MHKVKKVTIRDIAETCGVSIGTVSGVLNDRAHIRPAVRQKILNAIKSTRYNPLKSRTGVQSTLRKSIGLVLPTNNTLDSFFSRAVTGFKAALEAHNMNFLLYTQDELERITREEMYPGKQNLHCDGLVFFCPRTGIETMVKTIADWGIRAVVINPGVDLQGVPVITDDPVLRVRLGLEHLRDQGHRSIGLVIWFKRASAGLRAGYHAFLKENGLAGHDTWEYPVAAAPDTEFKDWVVRLFNGSGPRPPAMMCDSDQAAVSLVQYLQELGQKVPDQVAVAGINDDDLARLIMPGITSVYVPVREMLRAAVDQLARALEQGTDLLPNMTVVPNRLVVRGSTDPVLAGQPWRWAGYTPPLAANA
jgi:DNA-binding LacI/PurR family transcriptional regulator